MVSWKGVWEMGLYLAQLPPAELARLKAELAETLIANFCYPRFMDYRTSTLRMRPVDRNKRQEVWSFLSSYDFGAWGRIDVQSPEFQRLVERLLIQFIQRNRAFFGNQGRKRMSDVRSLIGSSSTLVTEGLRGHLNGRKPSQTSQSSSSAQAFGSPRLVISWSSSSVPTESSWEQIASATQQLQQQLQELRGEIQVESDKGARLSPSPLAKPAEIPAVAPSPKRSPRSRASANGGGKVAAVSPPVPSSPVVEPSSPAAKSIEDVETIPFTVRPSQEVTPKVNLPHPAAHPASAASTAEPAQSTQAAPIPAPPAPRPLPPAPVSMRELSRTPPTPASATPASSGALVKPSDNSTLVLSDEDVMLFEQMKYQLIVWLRVEAVRLGLDFADQTPLELIDLLRQQESFDETRLQILTTLLNLADTVSEKGQATVVDYKQAMMFYLMHTRHAR